MATPMELQYRSLKNAYPDCILFFRMGDFYESFDDDARVMSKVLGVALTSRSKEKKRPMAGIPYHALGNYLYKMTKAGYKVAIAEQIEDPKKAKGIVKRDVVRVVTPGTVFDEKSLDSSHHNYIAAAFLSQKRKKIAWGIAVCDVTTGHFWIEEFWNNHDNVLQEIFKLGVSEILVANSAIQAWNKWSPPIYTNFVENMTFKQAYRLLCTQFSTHSLKGFGIEDYELGITAAGMILRYLHETQKTGLDQIKKISYQSNAHFLEMSYSTIRNLELISGQHSEWSLLGVIDQCQTSMGKRMLYSWLIKPLRIQSQIENRLEIVDYFKQKHQLNSKIRDCLSSIYDIERIVGRMGNNLNARDLIFLRNSLHGALEVLQLLRLEKTTVLKIFKETLKKESKKIEALITLIEKSIQENPPHSITEGNIIKDGYSKVLDSIRKGAKKGKDWIISMQAREIKRTGIHSLKVRYNKVFGYFIEVSRVNMDKVPKDYIRKQTLANAERYITQDLKEAEDAILGADEKSIQLEYTLFQELRDIIARDIKSMQSIAELVANLDCLSNFAFIARKFRYSKPIFTSKEMFEVHQGRHPVIEQIEGQFIANDVQFDKKHGQIHIITGPNMAGKSTFIRQVALITILAHIGCFVPAKSMTLSIIDKIFTRVGASDNLAQGESTFMLEMNETSNILHNATKDSLIVLDEVGRGTSTYDGVAIAWSIIEYLHTNIKAKTLFATHYHELVQMEEYLSDVKNYNVSVEESNETILFLRKIISGGTDKSYGVHVAKLAGIPDEVIIKAKEILMSLEQKGMFKVQHITGSNKVQKNISEILIQQSLFSSLPESEVEKDIRNLNLDTITPLEALEKLSRLQEKLNRQR